MVSHLHGHDDFGWSMINSLHSPIISPTQLLLENHFIHVDLETLSVGEIDSFRCKDGLVVEIEPTSRIDHGTEIPELTVAIGTLRL